MVRGNQSDVARRLGISRMAVSKLVKARQRTGIPQPGEDGLYDLEQIAEWYVNDFHPTRGPRRGIRAEHHA